jgi:alcohol dehydrogenase class IV
MFPIPHGLACARLLAPVAAANVKALRARDGASTALGKYDEAARLLTGDPGSRAEDGAAWLLALVEELAVPRLGPYGLHVEDVMSVVAQAKRASSMQGNPVGLTEEELGEVLRAAV